MSKPGKKVHEKVVFKKYDQSQLSLPIDLECLIPSNHMVRVVNSALDQMNLGPLFAKYSGGGRASYHPVMMTKLIIYAYTDKIFSSRRMEKAARENIMYMWLCGSNTPDFKTINTFRGERMKDILVDVFSEIIELLHKQGYIKLENYFLDGTKIEANANKYSWVWGKSTKRYKEKLREKCKELFEFAELTNKEENEEYGERNLEELGEEKPIDSQAIEEAVKQIDAKLAATPEQEKQKKLRKAKRVMLKDFLPRMKKYEKQEELLAKRNSYSKTDTDATFMRMKEDAMKNGQLKPGYNVQMGTENQFIVGYSIHQSAGDTGCMKEHLEELKKNLGGKLPSNIIADAGYGSEENYEYLEKEELGNYVKYNTFHKEASKKWRTDPVRVQNWQYNEEKDEYVCSNGRELIYLYTRTQKSKNGYVSTIRVYESRDCQGCPYRDRCIKQTDKPEYNKRININRRGNELKAKTKTNLNSDYGLQMRSLRPIEVESVFGDIKGNFGMRRFMLKGLEKVKLEWGLHCIAHNMRKMAATLG
jgi:transposase